MPNLKSSLIDAYHFVTSPVRQWNMHQRRKSGQVPVYVLFYHRVADEFPNPWSMSCGQFERQIDWLEQNFQIVDLEECQRRIQSGQNDQPTVAITFDDGYSENCDFALPMLMERRIPVTYFVTLDHISKQRQFQHDIDNGQNLPVNTIESLRALSLAGVEIGAHTRNHPDLGKVVDPAVLVDEIITATRELEELVDQEIRYFAFPFGQTENLNAQAFHLLKQAGFMGACTTLKRWNDIGGDAFQLSRVHGDPDFSRFRNWLSFDPRLGNALPFDYMREEFDLSVQDEAKFKVEDKIRSKPDGQTKGQTFPATSGVNSQIESNQPAN